LELFSRHR
jgi:cysteinyl-tRNA synthetase